MDTANENKSGIRETVFHVGAKTVLAFLVVLNFAPITLAQENIIPELKNVIITEGRELSASDISPEGNHVVAGFLDTVKAGSISVWDAVSGQIIKEYEPIPVEEKIRFSDVLTVEYSPDGSRVLAVVYLSTVQDNLSVDIHRTVLYDSTGKITALLEHGPNARFTPDGQKIVSIGSGEIKIWDAFTGKLIRSFSHNSYHDFHHLAVSPDGSQILVSVPIRDKWGVQLVDMETGEITDAYIESSLRTGPVAFTPDGTMIISGNYDLKEGFREAVLRDKLTGDVHRVFQHLGAFEYIVFSPDGRLMLSHNFVVETAKGSIELWSVDTGEKVYTFPEPYDSVRSLSFSLSGNEILIGGKVNQVGKVTIWSMGLSQSGINNWEQLK